MSKQTSAAGGGIGFGGLLALLFIALKLTHNIEWSWWWVLAPLWIPMVVGLLIIGLWLVMALRSSQGRGRR